MKAGVLVLIAMAAAGTASCAHLHARVAGPGGDARATDEARELLARAEADRLRELVLAGELDPGDDLLRLLFGATAAHHAGRYRDAAALYDVAFAVSQDRVTLSLRDAAASLVSNDRVFDYTPTRTELLLIPYSAALGYLRLGDLEGAAVEARRIEALIDHQGLPEDASGRALGGTLSYFAATILQAAGRDNDAMVAFRRAARAEPGLVTEADTVPLPQTMADSASLIVVVESGYAARRVERSLYAWIGADDLDGLNDHDRHRRSGVAVAIARAIISDADGPRSPTRAALAAAADSLAAANAGADSTGQRGTAAGRDRCVKADTARSARTDREEKTHDESRRECMDDRSANPYLLKIAWAELTEPRPPQPVRITWSGGEAYAAAAPVSQNLRADFGDRQVWMLARAVLRAASKAALVKATERELAEKDETAGRILGAVANLGGVLLEQADTRSWSVLPNAVSVVRLRLPIGAQTISVTDGHRTLSSTVQLQPGRTTFLDLRAW